MAYSDQTIEAAMTMGLPGVPAYVLVQGFSASATVLGQAINYSSWYDCAIMLELPGPGLLGANYYASTIDEVVFTPNEVIKDVTVWKIQKPANSWITYFRMYDASNNVKYESWASFNFDAYLKLTLGTYVDDDWSLNVYDSTRPIYIYIAPDPNDPNWAFSFGFVTKPTPLAQNIYDFNPMVNYANNLGSASLSTSGYVGGDMTFNDYIDALYDGVYTNEGQIAPTGGSGGAGGGSFDIPDYEIGVPGVINFSVTDTGMVSLYNPTMGQLQTLGNYLWSSSFFDNIIKNFTSPLDNIITMQLVPLAPSQLSGTAGTIHIGNMDTNISSTKLNKQFYKISCGTLRIPEVFGSFADYSPYTPALGLYLPYCGIIQLQPDELVSGYIKVDYQVDIFSGSCVAYVSTNTNGVWHVIQQRSGNCCVQFPITGANYASVYIGAINSIASLGSGNMIGAMNQATNIKPEYGRSGGITSVCGMMGVQYPYLIREKPNYIIAQNFREVKGYTSNLTVNIGSTSGFLQATADNSELSSIGCTAQELDMIRNLLAEGIYI